MGKPLLPKPMACLSVDVDSLVEYCGIHGLDPGLAGNQVYEKGLVRFLELFDRAGLKATFFLIGRDLENPVNRAIVREAFGEGHELANHTWSHPYNLLGLGEGERRAQIKKAQDGIGAVIGQPPVGFRAPGYSTDGALLRLLGALGFRYDSSVFPSVPYHMAKLVVMAGMRLRGRRSASITGDLRMLLAPGKPYLPGAGLGGLGGEGLCWDTVASAEGEAHPGAGSNSNISEGSGSGFFQAPGTAEPGAQPSLAPGPMVELPISLLGPRGIPLIGTVINLAGPAWVRRFFPFVRRTTPFLNLEFHAIDLMGLEEDRLDPAFRVQPDLKIPLAKRLQTVEELLNMVKESYHCVTLADAALQMDRPGRPLR